MSEDQPRPGAAALRLVRATIANGAGTVASAILGVLLTPLLIHGLGVQGYGIFALALSVTSFGGYAALGDLGVEVAAVRHIAQADAAADIPLLNRTVSTAMAFFGLIGLVLVVVILALATTLVDAFSVSSSLRDAAITCFSLTGISLLFDFPSRALYAVLEGTIRFELFQVVQVVRAIGQTLLFVCVIVFDLGVGGMGAAMAIAAALCFLALWVITHWKVPGLQVRPWLFSLRLFRELMTFGSGMFVIRTVGTIYREMDKLIIGVALGAASVAIFEIANRLHLAASMVQSIAASALIPTTVHAQDDPSLLQAMFLRGTCYAVATALPFTLAALFFAKALILTWIGPSVLDAVGPSRILLVYLLFAAFMVVGQTMVVALGRLRVVMWLTLGNLGVNVVASLLLVDPLGVKGVTLGTLIAQAIFAPPQVAYALRVLRVPFKRWLRETVAPNVPGAAVQCALSVPLMILAERTDSFPVVMICLTVSVVSSLVAFLRMGLSSESRRMLFATIRGAIDSRPALG